MVYLVDASVYIFRAWFSQSSDARDAEGNPTHALYGFARFLGDLIERRAPRYLAVAFDESSGAGHRHALLPSYKANREPAPPELKRQFALCREFCRHLGVAEFASPEYEADDLIGTLATRVRAEGLRVTVVTRDKDLSQLVGPGDRFWDYSDAAEYAYEEIAMRFGVAPERMADYLALTGDAVDNIPGVAGIGAKTAATLLAHFGSLDAIYARIEEIPFLRFRGAAAAYVKLKAGYAHARLSRSLTGIACDCPVPLEASSFACGKPDLAAIDGLIEQLRFGPLTRSRMRALA